MSNVIFDILFVLNVILILYILLLTIRIVLAWFNPTSEPFSGVSGRTGFTSLGRPWELLCKATDPYLGLFYRMRFLRKGFFDFTPLAAVIALWVAQTLVGTLASGHRITLGLFLAAVTSAVWAGVSFILLYFLVVGVLRTIPILFRGIRGSTLWKVVDLAIQPVVSFVMRTLRLAKSVGYTQYLLITLGILFAAWLLGEIFVRQLILVFRSLPV